MERFSSWSDFRWIPMFASPLLSRVPCAQRCVSFLPILLLYDRVCSAQHVYCSSISVFFFRDPTLHRSELYPPFSPSFLDQSLLFSLLAVTSNLGSVASTQLMYSFQSPSHVFGLLAQFGAACAMAFCVFYPEESKKQKEESKSVSLSPRRNETLRLSLCFLAQFLVQF